MHLSPGDITAIEATVHDAPRDAGHEGFLDLARSLVRTGRVEDLALALAHYVALAPERRVMVACMIPPLVADELFPTLPGFDISCFLGWVAITPLWSAEMEDSCDDPQHWLDALVSVICESQMPVRLAA